MEVREVGRQGGRSTQNYTCASFYAFCKNRPTAVESNTLG